MVINNLNLMVPNFEIMMIIIDIGVGHLKEPRNQVIEDLTTMLRKVVDTAHAVPMLLILGYFSVF